MHVNLSRVIKQSIMYGYLFSQPFATYVDAHPTNTQQKLLVSEQLVSSHHNQMKQTLQNNLQTRTAPPIPVFQEKPATEHVVEDSPTPLIPQSIISLKEIKVAKQEERAAEEAEKQAEEKAKMEAEKEAHINIIKELSPSIYLWLIHDDVTEVQKSLQFFDFYEGEIDGIYGPLTKQGLERAAEAFDIEISFAVPEQITEQEVEEPKEEKTVTPQTEQVAVQETAKETTPEPVKEKEPSEEPEETVEEIPVETISTDPHDLISQARSLIGSPYVWGGVSPSGFDCSGFIQYVFDQKNIIIPRTVSEIWNFSTPVDSASVGDLVFFETYKAGPSHMGIYIGDGQFIHAGESNGVTTAHISDSYWKDRYLGAKRIH